MTKLQVKNRYKKETSKSKTTFEKFLDWCGFKYKTIQTKTQTKRGHKNV